MLKNGIYMVEDLHTAYWEEYEGGLRKSSTFIELCKNLIDELNADHIVALLRPLNLQGLLYRCISTTASPCLNAARTLRNGTGDGRLA